MAIPNPICSDIVKLCEQYKSITKCPNIFWSDSRNTPISGIVFVHNKESILNSILRDACLAISMSDRDDAIGVNYFESLVNGLRLHLANVIAKPLQIVYFKDLSLFFPGQSLGDSLPKEDDQYFYMYIYRK
jgi:hypothetical protein